MKRDNDWVLIGAGAVMGGAIAATATAAWEGGEVFRRFFGPLFVPLKQETLATLLTGLAAIVAAGMTVAIVGYQIRRSDWHEQDRRRRRARAALSALPLALVELYQYAVDCMDFHGTLRLCFSGSSLQRQQAQIVLQQQPLPIIPAGSISVFKECIEFEEEDVAEALSDLIAVLQVQNSRALMVKDSADRRPGARSQTLLPLNVDEGIVNSADLAARCSKLLTYGRQRCKSHCFLPDRADIRSAMWRSRHVDENAHSEAFERAENWRPMNWPIK